MFVAIRTLFHLETLSGVHLHSGRDNVTIQPPLLSTIDCVHAHVFFRKLDYDDCDTFVKVFQRVGRVSESAQAYSNPVLLQREGPKSTSFLFAFTNFFLRPALRAHPFFVSGPKVFFVQQTNHKHIRPFICKLDGEYSFGPQG